MPLLAARNSFGDVLSTFLVIENGLNVTLPLPALPSEPPLTVPAMSLSPTAWNLIALAPVPSLIATIGLTAGSSSPAARLIVRFLSIVAVPVVAVPPGAPTALVPVTPCGPVGPVCPVGPARRWGRSRSS